MLSTADLERLITMKKCEIEKEKIVLGLSPTPQDNNVEEKENNFETEKRVQFSNNRVLSEYNNNNVNNKNWPENRSKEEDLHELDENIPPDLERYIRRCTGLPVMLKAGEYSPNNPLIRGERSTGDVLFGLGEYERRRNTLRKLRQQQYKEYLDQQAKIKQEAKEKADRERREREEKERALEEERERRQLEQDKSPVRRSSFNYGKHVSTANNNTYITKVDTGVQVDGIRKPLSIAVQTDDVELYALSGGQKLTEAERELSPHMADQRWNSDNWVQGQWDGKTLERGDAFGDIDESPSQLAKKSNRDKLTSDLRHTYMPSIFDAEAIQMRNLQAEKEAAARRQFYQQELKNQILEQQRIREERKTREKLLEQAEMRRLEQQLHALRIAQQHEVGRQVAALDNMKQNSTEYEEKRSTLQKEIELEQKALLRATSQYHPTVRKITQTSHSDTNPSNLPFYYPHKNQEEVRPPYSINIPDSSVFSPNYDVESYLRRNLNPSRESLISNKFERREPLKLQIERQANKTDNNKIVENKRQSPEVNENVIVENAVVHTQPRQPKVDKRNGKIDSNADTLPIPVLRHISKVQTPDVNANTELSEAMQIVEDKWKVPAVQKNILKSLPDEEGKSVSILTQLGSIRRQLQLEQLKLDKMLPKANDV